MQNSILNLPLERRRESPEFESLQLQEEVLNGPSLLQAAKESDWDLVRRHIEAGVDVNLDYDDYREKTPLMYSAMEGHLETVKLLLKAGADVDETTCDGYSALILATCRSRDEVARCLLKAGASPNFVTSHRSTALKSAIRNGCNVDTLRALLEAGADVSNDQEGSRDFMSPLQYAAVERHTEAVKFLRAAGVDLKTPRDRQLLSALYPAILRQDYIHIECLAEAGLDFNMQGNIMLTPLSLAILNISTVYKIEVYKALLAGGSDPNIKNKKGQPAFSNAIEQATTLEQCELLVHSMLDYGADVNAVDHRGFTALHIAAARGFASVVATLLQAGADVEARDINCRTSLMFASQKGVNSVVVALLAAGAEANARGQDGRNALMYAAESVNANSDIVDSLVKAGGDVFARALVGPSQEEVSALDIAKCLDKKELLSREMERRTAAVLSVLQNVLPEPACRIILKHVRGY